LDSPKSLLRKEYFAEDLIMKMRQLPIASCSELQNALLSGHFEIFWGDPYGRVECSRRGEFPLSEALRLYPELAEGRVWKFERNKPSHGSKNVDQKRKRHFAASPSLSSKAIFMMPY
jgi:hypothetical protein